MTVFGRSVGAPFGGSVGPPFGGSVGGPLAGRRVIAVLTGRGVWAVFGFAGGAANGIGGTGASCSSGRAFF